MDHWQILGLEPTEEKEKITEAYHKKLVEANPEERPEEFMALRAAYEAALEAAEKGLEKGGDAAQPKTPLEQWIARVDAVYNDLAARSDPESWRQLLEDPVCFSLGGRTAARDALLHYFEQHGFLPQKIWQQLDLFFDFTGSRQELYESFPQAFIDLGVLSAVKYQEFIRFELFLPGSSGAAADEYIQKANVFRRQLREHDLEKAAETLAAMEALGAKHPYSFLAKSQLARMQDRPDDAMELCGEYLSACPDDVEGLVLREQLNQQAGNYAAAETDLRAVLAQAPELNQARYDLICVLENLGRHAEAKELLQPLQREQPRNALLQQKCVELDKALLPQLISRHAAAPEDTACGIELAWCHLQLGDLELAAAVVQQLPQSLAGDYEYENLIGKLCMNQQRYADALPHLAAWEQSIRSLDDPVKAQALPAQQCADRKSRLPEAMRLQTICRNEMGQKEQALTELEKLEELFPDDAETYLLHAQLLAAAGQTEKALPIVDLFVEKKPGDGYGLFLRGMYQFRLRRNFSAWRDLDNASRSYGRELNCMAYQCRILLEEEQWKQAEELLQSMDGVDNVHSACLQYCRALWQEHQSETDKAFASYEALLERLRKNPAELELPGDVWYRAAGVFESKKSYEELGKLLTEGVALQPDDIRLRDFLAYACIKTGRYDQAAQVYREMAARWPDSPGPLHSLGDLYRSQLRNYPEAVKFYRQELALQDTAAAHAALGRCLLELEDHAGAEAEYAAALAADPDQPSFLANMAGLRLAVGQPEQAAELLRKAIATPGAAPAFYSAAREQLAHALCRLGQWEDAAAQLEATARTGRAIALTDQASVSELAGRYGEALKLVDQWYGSIDAPTDETKSWYLCRRAELLRQIGQDRLALDTLREAAGVNARGVSALAEYYFDTGRYRMAVRLGKKCLEAAPQNERYLSAQARYLWFAKKPADAAALARQGLAALETERHTLDRALYYTRKAELLALAGQTAQAFETLEQAEHAPLCTQCNYCRCRDADTVRAFVCEILGDIAGASAAMERAMALTPREHDLLAMKKRLAKRKGASE